jgi:MtfA peptidase
VRAGQPIDRIYPRAIGALVSAALALLGYALAGAAPALGGLTLGLLLLGWLDRRAGEMQHRRARLVAEGFPAEWRRFLARRCAHYQRLPEPLRRRFEQDLRFFMAEKRVTGIEVEATLELRLLAAASAISLSVGWPDFEWDRLAEVLLYPQAFNRDYGFKQAERAGEAHAWGTIILSAPALIESFAIPDDAFHVGLHELAHILDVERTHFDGIPGGFDLAQAEEWIALRDREMEAIRNGRSLLDDYAAHDPVEFFPVSVETFFEQPLDLREAHPKLYQMLARYFGQDPAAWDEERH